MFKVKMKVFRDFFEVGVLNFICISIFFKILFFEKKFWKFIDF